MSHIVMPDGTVIRNSQLVEEAFKNRQKAEEGKADRSITFAELFSIGRLLIDGYVSN